MNPSFQTIGWADMVIVEDVRDPNDYNLGPNDPYNTDDDVVDDLFDQWLRSQGEDVSHGAPGEDMELAFELGAQLAMTKSYHKENGRSYKVIRQYDEQYNDAAIASLTDMGLDSENASIFDAFDAGYKALSPKVEQ